MDPGNAKRRRRKPITPDRAIPAALSVASIPTRATGGTRQPRGEEPQRRQRVAPDVSGEEAYRQQRAAAAKKKAAKKKGAAKAGKSKGKRKSAGPKAGDEEEPQESSGSPRPTLAAHKFTAGPRPDLIGNRFWSLRESNLGGPPRLFNSPAELADAIYSYFEWMQENPLHELKSWQNMGEPVGLEVPKMRAMTLTSLCLHIGISRKSLTDYEARDGEYAKIVQTARDIIFTQKFEGAAADMLNSNVIIRDLGLKERIDATSGDDSVAKILRVVVDPSEKRERKRKRKGAPNGDR